MLPVSGAAQLNTAGADGAPPHLLAQDRVLGVREAGAVAVVGQEQVPEPLRLRPPPELDQRRRIGDARTHVVLLGGQLRLDGIDVPLEEGDDAGPELLRSRGRREIHVDLRLLDAQKKRGGTSAAPRSEGVMTDATRTGSRRRGRRRSARHRRAGAVVQFFARYFLPSEPFFTTVQPFGTALNDEHQRRGAVPARRTTSTLTWSRRVEVVADLRALADGLVEPAALDETILQVAPVVSLYL